MFLLYACSDSTGPDAGEAVIQGSVQFGDGSSQQLSSAGDLQGATVTAARVTSNGSFESIGETQTQVNANGGFTMTVDMAAAQHLVIKAEHQGTKLHGFLAAEVENGSTYTLKPINVESSAEASVFARLVAIGQANSVGKADIETAVSAQAAASIRASTSAVNQIAASLVNAAQVRARFYAEYSGNAANQQMNAAAELRVQAQFQLEQALANASSQQQVDAAIEAYLNAKAEAYVNSGLSEAEASLLLDMYAEAMVRGTSSLSSQVRNDIRARYAFYSSIALDKAVRAQATASGFSQSTVQAIASAGTQLKATLKASSGASAEINAAFETYHEDVRSAMESDSSVNAQVIVSVDAEINSTAGVKAVFNTAMQAAATAEAMVQAYAAFTTGVELIVNSHGAGLGSANAEAVAWMMVLINLNS